jgi:hypothetical protein
VEEPDPPDASSRPNSKTRRASTITPDRNPVGASRLGKHNGVGPSKWTFWLVGAEYADEIEDELRQEDRPWGHIVNSAAYDIWVTTWGRPLDEAEHRLAFYGEQLKYDISQEEAVGRVRARHEELLPPASDPAEPAAWGTSQSLELSGQEPPVKATG